jgi:hypothetical protein
MRNVTARFVCCVPWVAQETTFIALKWTELFHANVCYLPVPSTTACAHICV